MMNVFKQSNHMIWKEKNPKQEYHLNDVLLQ